jgi:hypothetical protein
MQGPQYSFKVKYSDIHSLFLLPKPDGGRMAFVISLDRPIRQGKCGHDTLQLYQLLRLIPSLFQWLGNQRYQHLILETHKVEQTIQVNLTDEEIQNKYDGQLSKVGRITLSGHLSDDFTVSS